MRDQHHANAASCTTQRSDRSSFFSYNPYDGPNEHPEAELPLVAGKYLYVYGDMDDDGFYEGEMLNISVA